jgi:hypothetical protein
MLDKQLLSKDVGEYFKLQRCEELYYELQAQFKMNNVTLAPIAPSTITLLKVVETTKVEKTTNNIFGIVAIGIGM